MLIDRPFRIARRSAGLPSGFGPAALTAIVISLPTRANALDIRSQRANIVALRVSKMRPMVFFRSQRAGSPRQALGQLALVCVGRAIGNKRRVGSQDGSAGIQRRERAWR